MNPEMKSFLQEGAQLYVEAQNTLRAFESQMEDLLGSAVHARTSWAPMKDCRIPKPLSGGGKGGLGWWVAVLIKGISPRGEGTVIDCGFWWNAPEVKNPIIYANFYYEPKRVAGFEWVSGRDGINSFKRWKRTFLYTPLPQSLEIAQPLNNVLSALLKQLR